MRKAARAVREAGFMKIGVISDLHLSRGVQPAPVNGCTVYALAGDIGRPAEAIAWAQDLGKPVLYVPGNHEFYGRSLASTTDELRQLAQGTDVHLLDNEEFRVAGVRFLGSTLWTDFLLDGDGQGRRTAVREAIDKVHDFRRIFVDHDRREVFTPEHSERLFRLNAAWLQQRLQRSWPGPTVVITHHAPSAASIDPRFAGSPLNACFTSHLDHLLGPGVDLWIHGHMHHSLDYSVRGTRVVCNPRGYVKDGVNENPRFDVNFSVEVSPSLRHEAA
jgi:predicted phosphodiesterase